MIRGGLQGLGLVGRDVAPRPRSVVDRSSFAGGYPFDVVAGEEVLIQTLFGTPHHIAPNFLGLVQKAYRQSPIVFGLIQNRAQLFSEVRFQWLERVNGRPGDMFGTQALEIIEHPWPNGHTRDMLKIAEGHNAAAGNFFAAKRGSQLRVMRPDWTELLLGTNEQIDAGQELDPCVLDAELLGYLYWEGGYGGGRDPIFLEPRSVIHYKPTPDPVVPWRGMSWLTPIIEELCADQEMTSHKRAYLRGGATPNVAMQLDPSKLNIKNPEDFEVWVKKFEEMRAEKSGGNPYKIMFTLAGADPKVLGANLDQIDFSKVQSSGEVRMAVAAMVHPAIAAMEAGLQGSALNAGNFESAFRQFANQTMRPLWGAMAAAIEPILEKPTRAGSARPNVELTYDDRDVPALQEDEKKRAETEEVQMRMITGYLREGFTADSAVKAVVNHDLSLLQHTGALSVQLHEPGAEPPPAARNGSGNPARVPEP